MNNTHNTLAEVLNSIQNFGYQDKKYLNKGGMGEVSLANDSACQRKVVIKTLHEKYKKDNIAILRFIGEAQISSQLEHPNIIPVYDTGINEEGLPYYVMKYVEGMNLSEVVRGLNNNKPEFINRFTLNEILEIIAKICDAMNSAVSKGVLHRDLKPDNIMVGEYGEITIVDWGLAKIIDQKSKIAGKIDEVIESLKIESLSTEKNINLTMKDTLQGTPSYMAPERIIGEETEQGEVYAIGAIFYFLLTLNHMYPLEDDMTDLVKKVYEGNFKKPEDFKKLPHMPGGIIPPQLCSVLNKALCRDTESRYKKITDIRSEIDAYKTGYATIAENADFLQKVLLVLRRNKRIFLLLMTLTVLALFLTSVTILDIKREERKAEQANALAKSSEKTAKVRKQQAINKQKELDEKIEELKEKSSILLSNAKDHIKQMNFDKAKLLLESAVKLQPTSEFHKNLGYLHLSEKEYENAIESFSKASKLSSKSLTKEIKLCEDLKNAKINEATLINFFQENKQLEFTIRLISSAKVIDTEKLKKAWLMKIAGSMISSYLTIKPTAFKVLKNGNIDLRLEGYPLLNDLSPLTGMPLVTLSLINCKQLSLDPLKDCHTLKNLIISKVPLSDVTPLEKLSLQSLHIHETQIKDISPLFKNSRPILLNLANSKVSSLAGLNSSRLSQLDISNTSISDLSPLANSPLQKLAAEKSQCQDFTPLKTCPLKELNLNDAAVSDLNFLEDIELESLSIANMTVKSLKPLNVKKLKGINISNTLVRSLEPLKNANSLRKLVIDYCPITSLDDIVNLPLSEFSAKGAIIRDFSPVFTPSLSVLNIENSPADSLDNIQKSLNLQAVSIKNTNIQSLAPLKNCLNLRLLDMSKTKITDLTPISGKPLTTFQAANTNDMDLTPLSKCKYLNYVNLKSSRISDITPLQNLPLRVLHLEKCLKIKDITPFTKVKALQYFIVPYHLPIEQFEGFRKMNLKFIHWTNTGYKKSFWKAIDIMK